MIRELNEQVAEAWGKALSEGKVPVLIYEAPTGYGKSWLALKLFALAYEHDLAARLVHAAPTRSLVEDLYERKYLKRLRAGDPLIKSLDVRGEDDVGFQAMSLLRAGKDPTFSRKVVVTTIDSLFLNQFKIPVGELSKEHCHYELPRSSLASSMLVYDEAHLYGGDPGAPEGSTFTMFLASLVSHVHQVPKPVAVMTATMPSQTLSSIEGHLARLYGRGELFEVIKVVYGEGGLVDREWEEACQQLSVSTRFVENRRVVEEVLARADEGFRVLVVVNSPERAVKLYRELSGKLEVTLVHGRMTLEDRARAYEGVRRSSVVVSTQVVEVGIDEDFDVLITDPAPPSSLVQRVGRVCRDVEGRVSKGSTECEVLVIVDGPCAPYERGAVERALELLRKYGVEWKRYVGERSPALSVKGFLDRAYEGLGSPVVSPQQFVALTELDCKLMLSSSEARRLFRELEITTRGALLIPLYVGEEEPESYEQLLSKCVPVTSAWLRSRASKVLELEGGRVKAYFYAPRRGEEDQITLGHVELRSLERDAAIYELSFERGLLALRAREGAYVPGLGLLV